MKKHRNTSLLTLAAVAFIVIYYFAICTVISSVGSEYHRDDVIEYMKINHKPLKQ